MQADTVYNVYVALSSLFIGLAALYRLAVCGPTSMTSAAAMVASLGFAHWYNKNGPGGQCSRACAPLGTYLISMGLFSAIAWLTGNIRIVGIIVLFASLRSYVYILDLDPSEPLGPGHADGSEDHGGFETPTAALLQCLIHGLVAYATFTTGCAAEAAFAEM